MQRTSQLILIFILILLFGAASCQPAPTVSDTLELATSTENNVTVTITLQRENINQFILLATFTPQSPSLHLYSKDTPKKGLDGLGRPTLLEVPKGASVQVVGELIESIAPQKPNTPPFELLTYPAGPVTLSLPILLPTGNNWVYDEVVVTYMACDEQGCRPPVEQKPIIVRIPGQGLFQ